MPGSDQLGGAILFVDRKGSIVDTNERCQFVFGDVVDDLENHTLESLSQAGLFDAPARDRWQDAIETVLATDSEARTEVLRLQPPHSQQGLVYELTVTPVDAETVECSLWRVGTGRRYAETITALHEATRELMTASDIEDVLRRTAQAATDVLGFPGTGVRRYDPDTELLHHVSFGGRVDDVTSRPAYDVENSPHGRAIQRGETVIDDIEDDDPYDRDVFTQTMYIPVGKVGLLSVGTIDEPFTETDVRLAEILAENATAAITVVETTTSLRRERERLELMRQIFARILRHNIRNDMNIIEGYADMLLDHVNESHAEYVENIKTSADQVATLSEKARDLERILDDSHARQPLTLDTVLRRTAASVTREYPDVDIRLRSADISDVYAHGAFEIAVENLLENACQQEETTRVGVYATENEETVTVTIEDDGPGIPEMEVEVLDEQYETALEHGSGLGLWIVNWIVEESDGMLEFEVSDGTRVSITLEAL